MARIAKADHQTQGDVILARFAATTVPAALKTPLADFKKTHALLTAASKVANTSRGLRDDALSAVGEADDALDEAVGVLADKMVGAQVGPRKNPFSAYSKHSPSAVVSLAYADEVNEVLALTAKVKKTKPVADVAKAISTCEKLAGNVTAALGKLSKPQLAYQKSLAQRDALLPTWTKGLDRLKKNAAAAWFDESGTYKAIFAAPERVLAPVKTRPAKKTATPGPVLTTLAPSAVKPTV
jgi:hypothetical protein